MSSSSVAEQVSAGGRVHPGAGQASCPSKSSPNRQLGCSLLLSPCLINTDPMSSLSIAVDLVGRGQGWRRARDACAHHLRAGGARLSCRRRLRRGRRRHPRRSGRAERRAGRAALG